MYLFKIGLKALAQTVKHLPAKPETGVQSLAWEDLLEKEMAIPGASVLQCLLEFAQIHVH